MAFLPAQGGSVFKGGGGVFGALARSGLGEEIAKAMQRRREEERFDRQQTDTEARTALLGRQVTVQEGTEKRLDTVAEADQKQRDLENVERINKSFLNPETGTFYSIGDLKDSDTGEIRIPEDAVPVTAYRLTRTRLAETLRRNTDMSLEESLAKADSILRTRILQGIDLEGTAVEQAEAKLDLTRAQTALANAQTAETKLPKGTSAKNPLTAITTSSAAQGVVDAAKKQPSKITIRAKGQSSGGIPFFSTDFALAPASSKGISSFRSGLPDIGLNQSDIAPIFEDMPALLTRLTPILPATGIGKEVNKKAIRDFFVGEILALPKLQDQFDANHDDAKQQLRKRPEFKNATDEELSLFLQEDLRDSVSTLVDRILASSTVESDDDVDQVTDTRIKVPLLSYLDSRLATIKNATTVRDLADQTMIGLSPALADPILRADVIEAQASLASGDTGGFITALARAQARGQGEAFMRVFGPGGVDFSDSPATPGTGEATATPATPPILSGVSEGIAALYDEQLREADATFTEGQKDISDAAEVDGFTPLSDDVEIVESEEDLVEARAELETRQAAEQEIGLFNDPRKNIAILRQASAIVLSGREPTQAQLITLSSNLAPLASIKTLAQRLARARAFIDFIRDNPEFLETLPEETIPATRTRAR